MVRSELRVHELEKMFHTVWWKKDGFIPLFTRFRTCQIMQDFWTINSRKGYLKGWNQAEIHDACQALWSIFLQFEWFRSACSSSLSAGSSSLIHPKEESSTAWCIFAKASSLFNCHMNLFKSHNEWQPHPIVESSQASFNSDLRDSNKFSRLLQFSRTIKIIDALGQPTAWRMLHS